MIIDLCLGVLQGFLSIILAPLEVINIAVDFVASMPVVISFIQLVAYIFPWSNLLPLFAIVLAILSFKAVVGIIHGIYNLIPFVR